MSEFHEPDLKRDAGMLRDYHFILWVSALLGVGAPQSARDAARSLFRVRNFLHYLAGRREDVLRVSYQAEIARLMSYQGPTELLAGVASASNVIRNVATRLEAADWSGTEVGGGE